MKKLSKLIIVSLTILVLGLLYPSSSYAAGNLYLSPASQSVDQGATLSIQIRVSCPDTYNAVQANLSYPADKLEFLSESDSGSAFAQTFENTGGGGSVRIAKMQPGTPISGDNLVATVKFKALVGSGSAAISFVSGSAIASAGAPVPGGTTTTSGNYTFTTPTTTTKPTKPGQPAQPVVPPDTTAPKLSGDAAVTATSFNGATIEWKTDEPSTSVVEYGVNNKYGLTAESPGLTKDHKVTFNSELLVLGESYHFRVKSADAAGNLATGKDSTFNSRGVPVKIKVVDTNGKVIKKTEVTLASTPVKATTDRKGIATFADVAPGKHLVSTDAGGRIQAFQIEVKELTTQEVAAGSANPQSFEVKVLPYTNPLTRYLVATVAGLLVIIIGLSFLLWYRSKKKPI